jgi:SnoaL-like domain
MRKFPVGMILCAFLFLIACSSNKTEATTAEVQDTAASAPAKKAALELLDMSLAEPSRAAFDAFTKGDIDGLTAVYADNARFVWSSGDSLIGKQAIKDYYVGRWKLIDSLKISEHIFLPVQVNETQSQYAPTGRWLLHWALVNVKYKNGKKLTFWLHQTNHLNDAGKIDFAGQYMDRHPLIEATKGMKLK